MLKVGLTPIKPLFLTPYIFDGPSRPGKALISITEPSTNSLVYEPVVECKFISLCHAGPDSGRNSIVLSLTNTSMDENRRYLDTRLE